MDDLGSKIDTAISDYDKLRECGPSIDKADIELCVNGYLIRCEDGIVTIDGKRAKYDFQTTIAGCAQLPIVNRDENYG